MPHSFRHNTVACMEYVINEIHQRLPLVDIEKTVAKYRANNQPIDEDHYREMVAIKQLSQEWMEKVSELTLHGGSPEELDNAREVVRAFKAIWTTLH